MRSGRLPAAGVLAHLAVTLCPAAAADDLGAPDPSTAQGGGQNALELTIEETVALGLGNNSRLGALETQADLRESRIGSLHWMDNPQIRVRDLAHRPGTPAFDELEIGIRWRPPALGEPRMRRQRNKVAYWERRVEAIRERHWLASRVRRSCADLTMYTELARLAARRIENERRRIAQIETMVDLGRRSIVYFTKAKTAVSEGRQRHLRSLHAMREEERRLSRLTGISGQVRIVPEPVPQVAISEERLLALAYANRPELRLAEEHRQLALDRKSLESWRLLPQLSFLEVSRHLERSADDWHELILGIELPLFNRNAGNLRSLALAVSAAEVEVLTVRERIKDEVRETFSDYTEALLARDLTRREGDDIIQSASRVIAGTYDYPTVPSDEILELERTILDARVIMAESQRDLAHALYFLYYELGVDDPNLLLEAAESGR